MVIAYTVAGAAVVVLGLAGLLRLGKTLGERLAEAGERAPAAVRPPVAAGRGALSEEQRELEQWAHEETRRDLERIAALDRWFAHQMNRVFERTLADLHLDQHERNWARAAVGDYPLVGVR